MATERSRRHCIDVNIGCVANPHVRELRLLIIRFYPAVSLHQGNDFDTWRNKLTGEDLALADPASHGCINARVVELHLRVHHGRLPLPDVRAEVFILAVQQLQRTLVAEQRGTGLLHRGGGFSFIAYCDLQHGMRAPVVGHGLLQGLARSCIFRVEGFLPSAFLVRLNYICLRGGDIGRCRIVGFYGFLNLVLRHCNVGSLHLLLHLIVIQSRSGGIQGGLRLLQLRTGICVVEPCDKLAGLDSLVVVHVQLTQRV